MGLLDKILHKDKKEEKGKSEKKDESVVEVAKKKLEKKSTSAKATADKVEANPKTETVKPKVATAKANKDNTKNAYKVLVKPLISEKATMLGKLNQYIFAVNESTNKQEVKKAIASVYGITPIKVNIIKQQGKKVRSGRIHGKRKDWKKAIITLPKGQSIEVYEGT